MTFDKITDIKIYQDPDTGTHFLDITGTRTTDTKVSEVHLPKVYFPIELAEIRVTSSSPFVESKAYLRLPVQECRLCDDETGSFMYEKTIRDIPKKMTLDEIEKALGHKVEIVSGRSK